MGCCCSQNDTKIVVALFNYDARETIDISFKKGDRMKLISDSETDWWTVKHLTTKKSGLVPRNFVAVEGTVNCEDWYFNSISRKEAERLLMSCEHRQGTFLIRPSEQYNNRFSLSVKDFDKERRFHVKHYKIRPTDSGKYFIATNQVFDDLFQLVAAYSRSPMGLSHALSQACPREPPILYDLAPSQRGGWEIDRSEIRRIKRLGAGNFGEVFYGKWNNSIEVAIKTLREGTMSREDFLQEAAIMKQLRHSRLVALFAVCTKEEPVYIVQEYMCNGSLLDFLRSDAGRMLRHEELVYIAAQIAAGMEYLEKKQLVHRDLAARNVLVGKQLIAKVADFGLARIVSDGIYTPRQTVPFPIKWTAPEAIHYATYTVKSDIWSYGILLMELFTYGGIPYPGMTNDVVADKILTGYRMPKPKNPKSNVSDEIYEVMKKCWHAAPDRRPTFEYLRDFFENYGVSSEMQYRDLDS